MSGARWRLNSPPSPLFAQPFVQAQIKWNIKASRHWHLWWESTDDRRIPLTKGQQRGKRFHLMTSSCVLHWSHWLPNQPRRSTVMTWLRGAPNIMGYVIDIAYQAPSRYLCQFWNIVNSNLRNKLQRILKRNSLIFIQENAFENMVCEMAAILSRPQCVINNLVKWIYYRIYVDGEILSDYEFWMVHLSDWDAFGSNTTPVDVKWYFYQRLGFTRILQIRS